MKISSEYPFDNIGNKLDNISTRPFCYKIILIQATEHPACRSSLLDSLAIDLHPSLESNFSKGATPCSATRLLSATIQVYYIIRILNLLFSCSFLRGCRTIVWDRLLSHLLAILQPTLRLLLRDFSKLSGWV